jgi:hypothetical protein
MENLEKVDLNISSVLDNIVAGVNDIGVNLDCTYNIVSNYMAYDLLEYKFISSESISYVYSVVLEKYNIFFEQLQYIDINKINKMLIKDFKDLIYIPEINIFRLKNNLNEELNEILLNTELNIKEFIENTIEIYNICDKINYIISQDKHFEHILFKYNYVVEYINNNNINNPNDYLNDNIKCYKNQLLDFLQKDDKLVVIENTNENNKWNDDVTIIEISNLVCDKKIFIYLDLEKNKNKKSQIINLDINNKIYLITNNDDITNNYYVYIIDFIRYLINENF